MYFCTWNKTYNILYMELRVKEVCREKGVTLAEIASKIGIAQASLSKMLGGNPTIGTLEKIAIALDVPITELFSSNKWDLYGHIEYKGQVYTIKSRSDLENLLKIME
jgi:transcriptional regulator with XRE-family HTH domain